VRRSRLCKLHMCQVWVETCTCDVDCDVYCNLPLLRQTAGQNWVNCLKSLKSVPRMHKQMSLTLRKSCLVIMPGINLITYTNTFSSSEMMIWFVMQTQLTITQTTLTANTVWRKILMGENIDEFLSICQRFPYQNFTLIIFCHLHARPLFHAEHYC